MTLSKKVLGYITMNAGDGIPGSILKAALQEFAFKFDYSIVVDGNLTKEARDFYDTIPNLTVIDSPWDGRHIKQYWERDAAVTDGDWLLALDDDEYPSEGLMRLVQYIDKLGEANIAYIPSLTYLATDSTNDFWRVQEPPSVEDMLARSKRILYKKVSNTNYFISSPCGMHVTPTIVAPSPTEQGAYKQNEKPVGNHECFFYHMKTIESFIFNECVYNISNPRHERGPQARLLTEAQEIEFERLVIKYNLKDIKLFTQMTKDHQWPNEFRDFVYQFKHHLGQAMSKFYYLYEFVSKKDFSDTRSLIRCISEGFIPVYNTVVSTNEKPIVMERTPSIWQ